MNVVLKKYRLVIWMGCFASTAVVAFVMLYLPAVQDVTIARGEYNVTYEQLQLVTDRQRALEERLDDLQTQVDSVILDARREYRLTKPGERLEIIAYTD